MRIEHNGEKYYIDFCHNVFDNPVLYETAYRGEKEIIAITECNILKGEKYENAEPVAYAKANCAVADRFEKNVGRAKSLKRAVAEISDRELRGKLLTAYYTRHKKD